MKITISRGTKQGRNYTRVVPADGTKELHTYSRELTGTTGERDNGIFSENQGEMNMKFYYGQYDLTIPVVGPSSEGYPYINFRKINRGEIKDLLQRRIKIVREWVSGIDWEESFSFEI